MKTIITISVFLLAGKLLAQESVTHFNSVSQFNKDISLLEQSFLVPPKVRLADQYAFSRENPNELQTVFSGLFLFYKSFLSSQSNQRCGFHPSCSVFGLEAVKKYGVVRGMVCTFDRLARCNGLSPQQYEVDRASKLLADPVRW